MLKLGQIVDLDNASYHKRVGIRKAVEEAGCELLFLPTYSPDLNPIEQVWSQMKRIIKKSIRDGKDCLVESIDEAFIKICNFDFSNYFTHFLSNRSSCLSFQVSLGLFLSLKPH